MAKFFLSLKHNRFSHLKAFSQNVFLEIPCSAGDLSAEQTKGEHRCHQVTRREAGGRPAHRRGSAVPQFGQKVLEGVKQEKVAVR